MNHILTLLGSSLGELGKEQEAFGRPPVFEHHPYRTSCVKKATGLCGCSEAVLGKGGVLRIELACLGGSRGKRQSLKPGVLVPGGVLPAGLPGTSRASSRPSWPRLL